MSFLKFRLVPFANTPQNARNILRNPGQSINIVPGAFDQNFLQSLRYAGLEPLQDLYGEDIMLIRRGRNQDLDTMRDGLWQLHLLHSPRPSPAVSRLLDAFRY